MRYPKFDCVLAETLDTRDSELNLTWNPDMKRQPEFTVEI